MKSLWLQRLVLFERYLFLLFIYSLALVESPKNIIWGVLLFIYLVRVYLGDEKIQMRLLEYCVLAWIGTGILSTIFAIEPRESIKGLWDMIRAGTVLWIGTSHFKNEENKIVFLRHLLIATALASIIGFKDYFWSRFILHKGTIRVQLPSVGHFNQSGIYLAMAWVAGLATFLDARVFKNQKLPIVCLLIVSAAFLGTTARTAIMVAFGVSLMMLLFKRESKKILWIWLGSIAAGLVMILTTQGFIGRVLFRGSFHNRVEIWQSAWDEIQFRPWTGVGLNNFKNVYLTHATDWTVYTIAIADNAKSPIKPV